YILVILIINLIYNSFYSMPVHAKKIKKRASSVVRIKPQTPGIKSAAALAITLDDNQVLFSKNAFDQRSIASLTKLMAVLVLVDLKIDWNTVYTIPHYVFKPYYKTRLKPGLQFTAIDLLHSALLGSDNVAVHCLVEVSGLPESHFVQLMNNYAKRLNLHSTRFSDPTGYDENNVSTTYEISIIMRKVLEDPFLSKIVKTKYMTIRALNAYYSIDYVNTNRLLLDPRKKTLGGKTGFINEAGYCLVTTNKLDCGKDVIMVFLGANGKLTRFADANRMYDWLNKQSWSFQQEYSSVKADNKIINDKTNSFNLTDTPNQVNNFNYYNRY
ncbi:D-alanyl-D-alanine carboxypeptidase, partial [Candidatus Dependentiae bacterium]|nr:D-alanyl-D-alanine carboxypeptidase [Candidatus Dependentiae bacterium]